MSISLIHIKKLCNNITTYNEGYRLAQEGLLHDLITTDLGDPDSAHPILRIDAKFKTAHHTIYQARAWISTNKIIDFECNCDFSYKHACPHVIATLIQHLKLDTTNDSTLPDPQSIDDPVITTLLSTYKSLATPAKSNAAIKLIPTLIIDQHHRTSIECLIGTHTLYLIKDIFKFVQDIEQHAHVAYGKHLDFIHTIDQFSPNYQQLVKLIVDATTNTTCLGTHPHIIPASPNSKELLLAPIFFDRFFEMMADTQLNSCICNVNCEVTLKDTNPTFDFNILEQEDTCILTYGFSPKDIIFIHQTYLLIDHILYRCSSDFINQMFPLLKQLSTLEEPHLTISKQTMPSFYHFVLENLSCYSHLTIAPDLKGKYQPKPLHTKIYLDATQGQLALKLIFHYGDITFNPLTEDFSDTLLIRNFSKENKVLRTIEEFEFKSTSKDFFKLRDEEAIYYFIKDGLQILRPLADIHISKDFKAIKLLQPTTEMTLTGISTKSNLLELDLSTLPFPPEELLDILKAYERKKSYYKLKSGDFLALEQLDLSTLDTLTHHLQFKKEELKKERIVRPLYQAFYTDVLLSTTDHHSATSHETISQLINDLNQTNPSQHLVPTHLKGTLRDYQVVGFNWLMILSSYHLGGILADDMGLGKTLQVIALLLTSTTKLPSIIVMPTSLVMNWSFEIKRFAPTLNAITITGNASTRQSLIDAIDSTHVVLTSYDSLKRDIEYYQHLSFNYCIADEAHYIKNPSTQNAKALKALHSQIRFALTGTPIENRLSELWSIFDFIAPNYLGSYNAFKENFEKKIAENSSSDSQVRLKKLISPFILRRLKKDVLKELPTKTETTLYCSLKSTQLKLYTAYALKYKEDLSKELATSDNLNQFKVLSLLTRLRQICCHPSLFIETYQGQSAKLDLCLELTQTAVNGGHKLLIFSQFTSMLSILKAKLKALDISFYTLQGSTPAPLRQQLIDDFNTNDTSVFLISLKAGGVGLNLTSADVVIHYDPWWNVSSQNQATDRAHRIGQYNNVQVFKLITKDTIEEKIELIQRTKLQLSEDILRTDEQLLATLTKEDLLHLL